MTLPAGIGGQIGFGIESTYGTGVTPTRFVEFMTESLSASVSQVQSFGLGRGRFQRSSRHKSFVSGATGSVELPVMTKGFNLFWKHALGSHTATQAGVTSEYLHSSTVDSVGLVGRSLTVQVGRPDVGGTVRPFTFEGCKVVAWELKNELDGQLSAILELDAETETTGTALATASYASADSPFYFTQVAATLGGNAIKTRSISIKGTNALATDRRFLGNTKAEPLPNGESTIMVSLDMEFESLARHGQLVAGTELENLIVTWDTGVAIPSGDGSNFKLTVTIPRLMVASGQPSVGSADILREQVELKVLYDGTNSPIKIENWTTDTAA